MGFECSFNTVRRIDDVNLQDFLLIEKYLTWKNNSWNFEERIGKDGVVIPAPYPTFEIYLTSFMGEEITDCERDFMEEVEGKGQKNQLINKYEEESHDEYSYHKSLEYWCSDGYRYLDEYITSNLKPLDEEYIYYEVDEDFINKSLKWVNKKIDENKLLPYVISECFKENADGSITIIKCDGVIVNNGHTQKRIYTSDREIDDYILVPDSDTDMIKTLESFKECLLEMKTLANDNNLIWYERSW